MSDIHTNCSLCEQFITEVSIKDGVNIFCCHGCHAVYKILECQNQLEYKKNHPLTLQAIEFGLISDHSLTDQMIEGKASQLKKKWVFEVEGMWCPSCAEFIRLVIGKQKGVLKVSVDYITDLATIEFDPTLISKVRLKNLIELISYQVKEFQDPHASKQSGSLILQFSVAAFSALNVMMFAYPLYATYFDSEAEGMGPLLSLISFGLTIPVLIFSAAPLYRRMIAQARQGIFGMELLAGLGIISALMISLFEMWNQTYHIYFDTITVLITFLLLGKMIESRAKFSTKEALFKLHQSLPRKGRKCFSDGSCSFVPLKEIDIGDEIVVYSGERIVIDGMICCGEGAVDESVLTGESIPIMKKEGDLVLSGSILQSGFFRFKVTTKTEGSTLHHILKLVEEAIGNKTSYIRSVDKIITWFTPSVISVAFFTFIGTLFFISAEEAFSRSMAILLIACPCAIGIAAPLIESKVIQRFTERGALIQNRAILAKLPLISHFIFDKTGTITEGQFQVLSSLETLNDHQKIRLKTLTNHSLHPIAKALNKTLKVPVNENIKVQEVSGKGMIGQDRGETFYLGSKRFLEEMGVNCIGSSDHTIVYFVEGNSPVFPIILGDSIKKDVPEVLRNLKEVQRILLSGDQHSAVLTVAKNLEFDSWHAEHTPEEKQQFISSLKAKNSVVAMLGDGINDAPSLAKADIGISVVSATDISIQVSDLILTTPSLKSIPELISLSRFGQKLIKQNLFWAFFYNVIGIGLAICGVLTPLFASFAMISSSLMVLFNAQRIK